MNAWDAGRESWKIPRQPGDKAREYYRRYVGFRKDGDLDRARVEEARKKSTR